MILRSVGMACSPATQHIFPASLGSGDERSITQQCNPAGVHTRHFQFVDGLK